MSLVAWIILGFLSGFLARKFVNKTGDGFLLDIGLGIAAWLQMDAALSDRWRRNCGSRAYRW